MRSVYEQERQLPILAVTDVLVVGGGPAGLAAAVAVKTDKTTSKVDIQTVQKRLVNQGVRIR